ncbi:uncharacterized protein B0H18DRAFT_1122971 [Fomitopsis serialis]|uniref:uncharacterized protein n=1 Tax=Fomitopsis serialis TaxID=139415 RepID=UPI00200841FA|nr:uncharacterized protein B0H18DRAFT_1122969 [Neoantrodia serialis]XP_047889037.1 uncharacterized protein B0H18DRAFT_1122971 [Neoantrodia serialis]KAH9918613.1 hypothetical protein B0H18DRAFT_1122969 [Neoantrodia serialis]KAH9918615.1 hypothetical protein B0H18DRAFT_1122971 [Neoantrodia serialis]
MSRNHPEAVSGTRCPPFPDVACKLRANATVILSSLASFQPSEGNTKPAEFSDELQSPVYIHEQAHPPLTEQKLCQAMIVTNRRAAPCSKLDSTQMHSGIALAETDTQATGNAITRSTRTIYYVSLDNSERGSRTALRRTRLHGTRPTTDDLSQTGQTAQRLVVRQVYWRTPSWSQVSTIDSRRMRVSGLQAYCMLLPEAPHGIRAPAQANGPHPSTRQSRKRPYLVRSCPSCWSLPPKLPLHTPHERHVHRALLGFIHVGSVTLLARNVRQRLVTHEEGDVCCRPPDVSLRTSIDAEKETTRSTYLVCA